MTGLEWTLITILVVMYLAMLIVLGAMTLRKGRPMMFVVGIFFPVFWIVGAVMPAVPTAAEVAATRREHDQLYAR